MTRRTGNPERKSPAGQRVLNPFESTEETSTAVDHAPAVSESVFPVRRFVIEGSSAKVRAYGHVLTAYGWVREEQDNG